MHMPHLIEKKKDGRALKREEIAWIVQGITDGSIPDYQISALCMAIYFQGMNDEEIAVLTDEMAHSGDMIDLSSFGSLSVDKHSTGGVGDKTTLIIAPLVAACGAKVAKMSGRGLGHTGGTIDKLESIPGYRVELGEEEFLRITREVGVSVIGQSGELAPADKRLYALRDVTSTVDTIPLIVSSIMSKKLAAGAKSIVLDVTVGSGAFMKTVPEAVNLAEKMVAIGRACGRNISALITDMSEPLGYAIGNSLEVKEALAVLKGVMGGDLKEVCLALAGEMLSLSLEMTPEEGLDLARKTLESGAAYEKAKEWIAAQGGDVSYLEEPERFPVAEFVEDVISPESGYIAAMDTEEIGHSACHLGAGRKTKADEIDMAAGIMLCAKIGDYVEKGDVLATLYTNQEESLSESLKRYPMAITFSKDPVEKPALIHRIIR